LAKFSREMKKLNRSDHILYLLGKLIGGGDDERLGKGICPKPGLLTLPSPSPRRLFVHLDKLFSADPIFY